MSRPAISNPMPGPSNYPQNPNLISSRPPQSAMRRSSGSGQRNVSASRPGPTSVDSCVTRLLVVTRQLLQGLEQWSQGIITENDVSDIFVKLGDGFGTCVGIFHRVGISTQEVDSVPTDLRACLEKALAEEACQETLNTYLPEIKEIVFSLLQGLKVKQAAYRSLEYDQKNGMPPRINRLGDVQESRIPIRGPSSGSEGSVSPASISSQLPPKERDRRDDRAPSASALAERTAMQSQRPGLPTRPAPPDAFRPPRARPTADTNGSGSSQASFPRSLSPQPMNDHLVRHQLSDNPVPSPSSSAGPTPPPKPNPPHPDRFSRDSFGNPRPTSRFSADSDIIDGPPIRSPPSKSPQKGYSSLPSTELSSLPPALPTLNLPSALDMDNHVIITPPTESPPAIAPAAIPSLAALQHTSALERRASKRFSSYTFSKMVPGSPGKEPSNSPQRPTRRAPPMPTLPEGLSSLRTEDSDDEQPVQHVSALLGPPQMTSNGHTPVSEPSRSKTPEPDDIAPQTTPRPSDRQRRSVHSPPSPPSSIKVFLQIGKQVKKVTLELPITLSALRLLFMERFEYDPGMEDFPDVYVRDNRTGVQFELEDMEDLAEGSVLSLNIEPLDQVKQHFDLTFASLAQEIKEMKSALDHSRRLSTMPSAALLSISTSSRALDRVPDLPPAAPSRQTSPRVALSSLPTSIPLSELQTQQDEIQNLRRDLAIIRQVHVDFLSETKTAFTNLRTQNSSMREIVKTKMGGSRGLLDHSKSKLESQCQNAIQAVEEISDTIDQAREDAYRRFVTPSKSQMKSIAAELAKATEMVEQFSKDVTLADPTWRATWASELSRVMEEQRLLAYQNKLSADLKDDIKDAGEMLKNVQEFVDQRQGPSDGENNGPGTPFGARLKSFRPSSPTSTPAIPNLLMEIRTKEADPNTRLRAIEQQQRQREKELSARNVDEFSNELSGFVGGKKLRKTGGTEEVDRLRQRRQDLTIKRMLTGDGAVADLSPQRTGGSMAAGVSVKQEPQSPMKDVKVEVE